MEAYFWAFVNFEQDNLTQLLFIAEFAYNNTKNTNTGHASFELNCGYHFCLFYMQDIDFCLNSKFTEKLSSEF